MNNSIHAHELDLLLDRLPPSVRVLSLDCFDTIVWRKVVRPTDVFFNLQNHERVRAAGITAALRAKGESDARRKKNLSTGSNEVSLAEVYRELMPQASAAQWQAMADDELACEIQHAFIFEPVAALISQARARGLKVIVVSDTYLSGSQLRRMLAELMGPAHEAITTIYSSSDAGVGKTAGIWKQVLHKEKLPPQAIFHLGDNRHADQLAPARFGIGCCHLVNHGPTLVSQLKQRASVALQLMPELRHTQALPSLFHAQFAAHRHEGMGIADHIGRHSLGPVLYAFARFIEHETQALQAAGAKTRIAFLLRDGHMPALAFEALTGTSGLSRINVSRFTSIAASLRTRDDVLRLLANSLSETSMAAVLKQLLLPPDKARQLMDRARKSAAPVEELTRLVLRDDTLRLVFARSAAFRERLLAHVRQRTGIESGETLVLVDLGYSGTVQTRLAPIFEETLGVTLHGLYLIAGRVKTHQNDRKGLIDGRWADERLILALTAYIGVFEMMCTNDQNSTEDYTDQGEPVFTRTATAMPQARVVEKMQAASLGFVRDTVATPAAHRPRADMRELAQQATADLARLIYFPSAAEIACLSAFEFDFNLGTDLILSTANLDTSVAEYRREGFALMNRDYTALRVGYPMEMRHMDVSFATTLMSTQRFGYGLVPSEASFRKERVPTLVASAQRHAFGSADAVATHDGYFSLHLPMSAHFDQSLLLGQRFEWLQLDAIEKIPLAGSGGHQDIVLGQDVFLDGVEQCEGNLLKLGESGLMLFPACSAEDNGRHMIRVVFRPVLTRNPAPAVTCERPVEATSLAA